MTTTEPGAAEAPRGWQPGELLVLGSALALAAIAALAAYAADLPKVQALVGLLVILSIAYAASTARHAIDPRTVFWGLGLQIVLALLVLKPTPGQNLFV